MRIITLDINKKIIGVKNIGEHYILEVNDIKSDIGELGQVLQLDGSFVTPIADPIIPQPTLEDKINYIYYKNMGVI